jgi:PAS domain S-box-containing protein
VLVQTDITTISLSFEQLPAYAGFLLGNKLGEVVSLQHKLSLENELPFLKDFIDLPVDEQHRIGLTYTSELLTLLSENRASEQISKAAGAGYLIGFSQMDRYAVSSEDIIKMNYVQRKTFLHFLPDYSTDGALLLRVMDDIDSYLMHLELAASRAMNEAVDEQLAANNHLLGQISNTLPGALYIYGLDSCRTHYGNGKLEAVLGYSREELNDLKGAAIGQLTHPGDQAVVRDHIARCSHAADGEILSYKSRVRQKDGRHKWIRNFESVFKRDANGRPMEMIAIALDVDNEKRTADRLKQNEGVYRQAERLSNIGSWHWEGDTNELTWTDQLYTIYGLEPQAEKLTLDRFLSFVHPADRALISESVRAGFTGEVADYTFRIVTAAGEEKRIRSIAQVTRDESGAVLSVTGTEHDITERETLLEQLKENEALYEQAQAIAHLGNWGWDARSNRVSWSQEMYRIFGVVPHRNVTFELFIGIIHAADRDTVIETIRHSLNTGESYDFYYRIVVDGSTRTIHSRGQRISRDGVDRLVGTAQDVSEWRNMVEKLQLSEQNYKQAQALAKIGNWSVDPATEKIFWSEEMFRIYETDREAPYDVRTWLANCVHPEDRDRVLESYHNTLETGAPLDQVHRILLPDGRIKILHRRASLSRNEQGEPVALQGTTQDITEQRLVERELENRQRFIEKITDATPSVIASYHILTGEYAYVSEGLEKLLGYSPAEVYQKGSAFVTSLVHPDDLADLAERNRKAMEGAEKSGAGEREPVLEFTYRMRHSDGGYRWFHTYGTVFDRDEKGHVSHVLTISLDVTEQREASQKITDQEYFIQQIADASPTILYLFDVGVNAFAYVNREIFYVLGYSPEEILALDGDAIEALYHPDDRTLLPERKGSDSGFKYKESMMQYECRLRNKGGEWCWFLVREIVFKKDGDGNISQVLGAALDISKRKEMERTLVQNAFQLEQSNASLEEFAYVASHDLKEPLRKISTFGDRLVSTQSERLSDDGRVYLSKVVDASRRMQVMIDDLLSVSMISGNRAFQPHSLQAILEDARQAVESRLEQKGARIESDKLPEARIVASQFRQLFQNLMSNSLKFSREGVPPVLSITHSIPTAAEIESFNLPKSTAYLRLTFRDNGIGFENESAGKIFQIFQRLHGRSEYEGTGIGLAICKKIVEHHGGVIFATGVPNEGATFTILLPQ